MATGPNLTITGRNLPHWEQGGATYHITFRLRGAYPCRPGGSIRAGELPPLAPEERRIVKNEILFWHTRKWAVDALTVLPDHVHILARPLQKSPGVWFSLAEILHSVKRRSAWEINRLRGRRGPLWQSERMDRIARDEAEFDEKAAYILDNARRRGLVEDPWEYDAFWCPGKGEPEGPRA